MVNNPAAPVGDGHVGPTRDLATVGITRAELISFLQGRSAINGMWFADRAPGVPAYWWRGHLHLFSDPIPMVLHCPSCGSQHIDATSEGWDNPPHRSHLCGTCKCVWRPADVPTVGVASIVTAGKGDTWSPPVVFEDCYNHQGEPPFSRPAGAVYYEAPTMEELERRRLMRDEGDLHIPPRLLPEQLPAGCENDTHNSCDDEFPTGGC